MNDAQKSSSAGFTAAERAAMKERAAELKAEARADKKRAEGEAALLAKLEELSEPDRGLAERFHALVTANAPELAPKTWYGMPAYARDGVVVCFFQPASKFDSRYSTIGFQDPALLDEGSMWATAFAVTEGWTSEEEAKIVALVRKAVG